jgi:hypothetical protein
MHILMRAVCNDGFPTRPNANAYKAYINRKRDSEKVRTGPRSSFSHVDHADEHWVIVDSGANKHYIARRDLLSRVEDINVNIVGIGDNKVTATAQGLFTGELFTKSGVTVPFDSFAYFIPNAKVSLFSVPQANWGSNDVTHLGTPAKGKHGLTLASGEYIPFEFCHETGLYWMKIRKASAKAVFHAEQRLTARIASDLDYLRHRPEAVTDHLQGNSDLPSAYSAWVRDIAIHRGGHSSSQSNTTDEQPEPARGSGPLTHNLSCTTKSTSFRALDADTNK